MTTFWIFSGLMTVAAVLILVLPMLRAGRTADEGVDRATLNTGIYRQRLRELERELADGLIDQAQFDQAKAELEEEAAIDLAAAESGAGGGGSRGRLAAVAVAVVIPAVSLVLYNALGSVDRLSLIEASRQGGGGASGGMAGNGKSMPSVEEMVGRLEEKLQADPANGEGWRMLGRSYSVLKRHSEAALAYRRARGILGDSADLLASEAEALALAADGDMQGEAQALIDRALELEPDNPQALWLGGFAAAQRGDDDLAVSVWRRLLERLPPGDEAVQVVQQQIERLTGKPEGVAAAPPPAGTATRPDAAGGGAKVEVTVDLAPELRSKASPEDTVFIFARAVSGPPMPLAVVRKQVRDLPVTVVLDDSMAMMPAARLSGFDRVYVGARISKGGGATPQSGDLQGRSEAVAPAETPSVRLVIDQEVL